MPAAHAHSNTPPVSMGQLLCALAYASDLAFGLQLEDSLRSCYLAVRLARALGLSDDQCAAVYCTALLKDAGCTSWTTELAQAWHTDEIVARRELAIFGQPLTIATITAWMRQYVAKDRSIIDKLARSVLVLTTARDRLPEEVATSCATASRIAQRLGLPASVQTAILDLFEQWNGHGFPHGLRGEGIPYVSRVVLPTFFLVPVHRARGREAAVRLARALRGQACDPTVIDAFLQLAEEKSVWDDLESHEIQATVLDLERSVVLPAVGDPQIDDLAFAFADFIDLKSRYAAAHSRRVGAVAEQVARLMGCAETAVVQIRRAALLHDLGLVAIPSYALDRTWSALSAAEQDGYRLHPHHGERVLRRVPALAPLADMVGTHHERMDGSGYYRGLTGAGVSLGARIIAVADRLDELTHDAPGRPACAVAEALDQLGREPLDQDIVAAVRRCLGERPARVSSPPRGWPAGLTMREVEVLRLAARGLTRREMSRRLAITENTVRHHLEHVYNKTATANRVSATLFAMEHGLLSD